MDERARSMSDRLANRTYMGVCKWESKITVNTMKMFPRIIPKYNTEKKRKSKNCIPKETQIQLPQSHLLGPLNHKEERTVK